MLTEGQDQATELQSQVATEVSASEASATSTTSTKARGPSLTFARTKRPSNHRLAKMNDLCTSSEHRVRGPESSTSGRTSSTQHTDAQPGAGTEDGFMSDADASIDSAIQTNSTGRPSLGSYGSNGFRIEHKRPWRHRLVEMDGMCSDPEACAGPEARLASLMNLSGGASTTASGEGDAGENKGEGA